MAGDVQITFDAVLGGTAKADLSKLKNDLAQISNKTYQIKLKDNSETIIRHLTRVNTLAKQLEKGFDIKVSSKSPISKYFKNIQGDVSKTVASLNQIGTALDQIRAKNFNMNFSFADVGKETTGRYIENVRNYVRGLKQAREMIAQAASNKDINKALNASNKQQLRDFMFSGAEFDTAIASFEKRLSSAKTMAGAERIAKDAKQYWERLTPLMKTIKKTGLFDMGSDKLGAFPAVPNIDNSGLQAFMQALTGMNLQIQNASIQSGDISGNFNQVAVSAEAASAAVQEVATATQNAAQASEKMIKAQEKTSTKNEKTASGKTPEQQRKEQENLMWKDYRAERQMEERRIADENLAYAERKSLREKEASERRAADQKAANDFFEAEDKKTAKLAEDYEKAFLARRKASQKQMTDAEKDYNKSWTAAEKARQADMDKQVKSAESKLAQYEKGYQKLRAGQFGDSKEVLNLGNQLSHVQKLAAQAKDIKLYDPDAAGKLNELSAAVSKLGANYETVKTKAKEFGNAQKVSAKEASMFARQSESMQKKIQEFIDKNQRVAGTSYEKQLQGLVGEMDTRAANKTGKLADLKGYEDQFNRIKAAAADAGKVGNTLGQTIAGAVKQFGGWMLVTHSIMSVINAIKGMIGNVRDLDKEMTELKKVTDLTSTAYEDFYDRAKVRAKETGATLTDTIRSTADMARLGLTLPEAETMADAATIYKNVGDGIESIDEASQSVISTVKAFGMQATDAMQVVDKFNATGNSYAISSAGVGEAMTRSASAMAAAGNTLDETIALIAAGNEVVKECATCA